MGGHGAVPLGAAGDGELLAHVVPPLLPTHRPLARGHRERLHTLWLSLRKISWPRLRIPMHRPVKRKHRTNSTNHFGGDHFRHCPPERSVGRSVLLSPLPPPSHILVSLLVSLQVSLLVSQSANQLPAPPPSSHVVGHSQACLPELGPLRLVVPPPPIVMRNAQGESLTPPPPPGCFAFLLDLDRPVRGPGAVCLSLAQSNDMGGEPAVGPTTNISRHLTTSPSIPLPLKGGSRARPRWCRA